MLKRLYKFIKHLPYYRIVCTLTDTAAILLLSAIALLVPLYYDYSVNNIYVLPKVILLRKFTLYLLALFAFRTTLLYGRLEKTRLFFPIIAFLIAASIATTQSLNPYVSLFGCYSRYEGLTSIINYILIFYMASHFVKQKWQARLILASAVLSGLLSGGYGVLQHFNADPNWLVEMGESSTFGNRNFLSAYLVLCAPLSLALGLEALDSKLSKKRGVMFRRFFQIGRIFQVILFFLGFLFFIFAIIIIQTRGAWLGLFFSCLFFLIFLNLSKKRLCIIFGLLILCVVPIFFFSQTSPIDKIKGTIKKDEKGGVAFTGSALVRIYIWESTLELIRHHPLGVGPDSLKFAIPWYISPDYYTLEGGVLDKAHNIILETAATTGWLGIASYIWLWIVFFGFGISIILHKKEKRLITLSLLSLSVAYLIQNLFHFDSVEYTFLFWIGMGIIYGLNQYQKEEKPKLNITSIFLRGAIFCLLAFGLFYLSKVIGLQLEADKVFAQARNYEAAGLREEAISLYEKADLMLGGWEETYHRFLVPNYENRLRETSNKELIKETIERLKGCIKYDPNNTSYYGAMATAYKKLSALGEEDGLKKAEETLLRAIKQNPNSPEMITTLGVFYTERGDWKKACETYEGALKYQKKSVRGRITTLNNLGEAYFRNNQDEKAIRVFSSSLKEEEKQGGICHYLALIYFKKENYGSASVWCKKALEIEPKNAGWWNDSGSAYYKGGKMKEAKKAFEEAIKLDPNNEYAKKVLAVIPN
ncbi:tetratricopeptide repeat protein [bacterium]|nr:tetratricopeptide repeat protein [bacterium]